MKDIKLIPVYKHLQIEPNILCSNTLAGAGMAIFNLPTFWDNAAVYKNLILALVKNGILFIKLCKKQCRNNTELRKIKCQTSPTFTFQTLNQTIE